MCLTIVREQSDHVGLTPRAAIVAAAGMTAELGIADRQIDVHVGDAIAEMAKRLGGAVTEVVLTVHHDHAEVLATRNGRMEHRSVDAEHALSDDFRCTLP